jgi:D-aspartate ligase
VLGGADLVRALGLGGVSSAVVAPPEAAVRFLKSVVEVIQPLDAVTEPERLIARLLEFASAYDQPLPIYYDNDWDLLLVSRHREKLESGFRFVVAGAELVERLVDKARFQRLAEELDLPVPAARRMTVAGGGVSSAGLTFPLVAKPLTRHPETWGPLTTGKALLLADRAELRSLERSLAGSELELLLQEFVAGEESRIESYHVYVDTTGETAGEFTGRKLRTYPSAYGFSTAVVITDSPDVRDAGRECARRLELRGVAKFDFKRGPDGRLHLLEVNPRFNLWHHPGAVAGVNLPAIVHADLTGVPRPPGTRARPGVRWCHPAHDPRAARQAGMAPLRWLVSAVRYEAKSGFAWDDPLPLARAGLWRVRERLGMTSGNA